MDTHTRLAIIFIFGYIYFYFYSCIFDKNNTHDKLKVTGT